MLYLSEPSDKLLELYFTKIYERIENAKAGSGLSAAAINFLTKTKIEEIIKDKPNNLLIHHNNIIPLLRNGFSIANYEEYLRIKKIPAGQRSIEETNLFALYDQEVTHLKSVFNYDEFISGHKITSYWLASQLDRNTCTYCNRLYTNTVITVDDDTGRVNDSTRIIRPQFDHWFIKSNYPILALSFYNLIPSCSTCNSSIKGNAVFSLNSHLHPYIEEINESFTFSYNSESVHENNVKINVTADSKIDIILKEFKIQEVYNAHSGFELKDLLELRYKYSDNYLETLFNNTFKALEVGEEEAYRLVFGVEYQDKNFHKRPFSKFKKDILKELGITVF